MDFYPWKDIQANNNILAAITPRGAHGNFLVGRKRDRWFKKPMTDFLKAVDQYEEKKKATNKK